MKSKIKYENRIYQNLLIKTSPTTTEKQMILIGRNEIDVSHLMANPLNVLPIDL
jgi:hypothetical protein